MRVLGVDACKDGWVGICLDDDSGTLTALCNSTIASLVAAFGSLDVTAIDIPIGLPTSTPRLADRLARSTVGRRSSSVFTTPPREVLAATTHAEASDMCRELFGSGISQQSFALRKKIFEVDEWINTTGQRVVEVHPEVSFAMLSGLPLAEPKSSWAGFQHRHRLLADAGIVLDGDLGLAGRWVAPRRRPRCRRRRMERQKSCPRRARVASRSSRGARRRAHRLYLRMRWSVLCAASPFERPTAERV